MNQSTISDQFIRKWSLVIYNDTGTQAGIVLSSGNDTSGQEQLRIVFNVQQTDAVTPNICDVKIYNVSTNTAMAAIKQYTRLTLAAGYTNGKFGTIFDGTIAQFEWGGETAVDTYLHLFAQDGDLGINNAVVNTTLTGSANTPSGRVSAVAKALAPWAITSPNSVIATVPTLPVNPRGQVLFGMAADNMQDVVGSTFVNKAPMIWSVQNGVLTLVPSNAAIPDNTIFILNSLTGLIGFPNTASDGIEARSLLNPSLVIRRVLQINNNQINQTIAKQGGQIPGLQLPVYPGPADLSYIFDVSNDGTYIIQVVNHIGDSRGNDWYTDLTCFAATPTGVVSMSNSGIPASRVN